VLQVLVDPGWDIHSTEFQVAAIQLGSSFRCAMGTWQLTCNTVQRSVTQYGSVGCSDTAQTQNIMSKRGLKEPAVSQTRH
jgi:hypothetical protein